MIKKTINKIKYISHLIKHKFRDIGIGKKRSSHWGSVREHFLKNNSVCACCHSNIKLNVHHKKPFHLHPELELDENNLITLCMSKSECHFLLGHGGDFKAYNDNIDDDVKIINNNPGKMPDLVISIKNTRKYN